jgi:hypothetical protein
MRAALVGVILFALVGPAFAAEKAVRRDETAKDRSPDAEARHPAPVEKSEPTSAPREERRDTPAPTAEPTRPPDPTPPRDETAKERSREAEGRHPAPSWAPDPTPTPEPDPTPAPEWPSKAVPRDETAKERSREAEARHPAPGHPRPDTREPIVMPTDPPIARLPAPTPTPAPRTDVEPRHPRPHERGTPTAPPPASWGTRPPRDRDDHARPDRENRHHGPSRPRIGRGHLGPHYHHRRFVPESCLRGGVPEVEPWPTDDPQRPNYDGMAALRLLVDPPETRVFVDGYFAGLVEDFDGLFQRLHLPEGCHELSLVLAGHRTHRVRVYATPDRALKVQHSMRAGEGADVVDLSEGLCRAQPPAAPPSSTRDFEIDRQHWFLAYGRLTTVVGLVRGQLGTGGPLSGRDAASLGASRSALASVLVRVEARSEGGAVLVSERESRVEMDEAGAFLTSYRLDLAPGRYTLHLGVRERVSGRLSVISGAVDVPDLHASEVAVPSVFILESMRTAPADPRHPLAAFFLEQAMPVPRFGNRFRPTDAPMILFQFARRASASAILASYVILGPDATTVAHEARLQADHVAVGTGRAVGAAAFGPLPLTKYRPGLYRVLVTVTDVDSRASYAQEAWFEVEAGERTALSWPGDSPVSRAAAPKP